MLGLSITQWEAVLSMAHVLRLHDHVLLMMMMMFVRLHSETGKGQTRGVVRRTDGHSNREPTMVSVVATFYTHLLLPPPPPFRSSLCVHFTMQYHKTIHGPDKQKRRNQCVTCKARSITVLLWMAIVLICSLSAVRLGEARRPTTSTYGTHPLRGSGNVRGGELSAANDEEREERDGSETAAETSLRDLNSRNNGPTNDTISGDNEKEGNDATTEQYPVSMDDVSSSDATADGEEDSQEGAGSTNEETPSSTVSPEAMQVATAMRLQGKGLHDQGDFVKAAELFQAAADSLLGGSSDDAAAARMTEEYATCRLHQALCHLKSDRYELCIEACTDVLQDGDGQDNDDGPAMTSSPTFADQSPAVKARAYHRRAKAKMGLGDAFGALQDARTAAFLGDGKAVALYGKIMRESSSSSLGDANRDPLLSSPSSALLESLLQKSPSLGSSLPDFSPTNLFMGNGNSGGSMLDALGAGAGGGLAKSMLKNLARRMDDDATHKQISSFLQGTNTAQLRSLASMAGMNDALPDATLNSLVRFCHGVKPKHIKRTVQTTKVTVYMVKLIRRLVKLINKYKTVLAALLLLQWMKSATLRPIPINQKMARKAAKQALKEGMKATRGMF
jgi:hypothetical protein